MYIHVTLHIVKVSFLKFKNICSVACWKALFFFPLNIQPTSKQEDPERLISDQFWWAMETESTRTQGIAWGECDLGGLL